MSGKNGITPLAHPHFAVIIPTTASPLAIHVTDNLPLCLLAARCSIFVLLSVDADHSPDVYFCPAASRKIQPSTQSASPTRASKCQTPKRSRDELD